MIIDCVYKKDNMCLAVNEKIENIEQTRCWNCGADTQCCWRIPGATGRDRDKELMLQYKEVKKWKPSYILDWGQLSGHDSYDENDISTISYEACMLALFMKKQWKYLKDDDFCTSYKHAKRLGFRIPTNANKAYRIRKKRCGLCVANCN